MILKDTIYNLYMWILDRIEKLSEIICFFCPVRNDSIMISNYSGRGYGDNLAPIVNELKARKLKYRIYWQVSNSKVNLPDGIIPVLRGSFMEKYYVTTAKLFIANSKGSIQYIKKKNCYYIQTWHGDMPFKLIEAECESSLPPTYVKNSKLDSRQTDYILSGSSFFSKIAKTSFWYNKNCNILEYGTPRNDIFFTAQGNDFDELKRKLTGSSNCKIALYAPTFRDDGNTEAYQFNAKKLLSTLVAAFGGCWKLVIRLHPNVAKLDNYFQYDDDIINGTWVNEAQELSIISSVLITDYSSIIEEFVITKKPVFILAKDLEQYQKSSRPLRKEYFDLPFKICTSERDLLTAIKEFDPSKYSHELRRYTSDNYITYEDGKASSRVVDLIEKIMERHG